MPAALARDHLELHLSLTFATALPRFQRFVIINHQVACAFVTDRPQTEPLHGAAVVTRRWAVGSLLRNAITLIHRAQFVQGDFHLGVNLEQTLIRRYEPAYQCL